MDTLKILLILATISMTISIKVPIVNEDYIDILIGTPPTKMRLLIDPVAPFSYINTNFSSVTYETQNYEKSFSNIFGNFEGVWASDFFYLTTDKYLPLKMKFLMINKSNSGFKIDGVIGLGYSEKIYPDCSVYSNLAKLSNLFETQNVLSYDKAKKLLTIGELPERDSPNPVTFPIYEGEQDYPATFVNITSILLKSEKGNNTFLNVTGHAKLGLMPVIIAPKQLKEVISERYNEAIKAENSTYTLVQDETRFYSTYQTSAKNKVISTEMVFGKIAYKYDHIIKAKKDNETMISNIRIGENDNLNFWYVGIDQLNVHRADFDFTNGQVILYSPTAYDIFGSKAYILFTFILFGIAFSIVLGVIARTQCAKKRQSELTRDEAREMI